MISKQTQAFTLLGAIVLLLGNVVAFNMLFGRVRGVRADLTEGKIYTLAPQTRELLQEPEEPLEIFFYHTALDRLHEKLRPLVGPLSDVLREFEAASNGKITTRIVEWDSADKATQDRAKDRFGVKASPLQMQTSDEETVRDTYFSIVVAYGDQHQRFDHGELYLVVPTGAGLDIDVKLQNVEYLVAKAIYKVVRGFQSIGAALATNDQTARIELYFSPAEAMPKHLEKVPQYAAKVVKKLVDEGMGRIKSETVTVSDKPEDEKVRERLAAEYRLEGIPTDFFSQKLFYSYAVITTRGQSVKLELAKFGEEMSEFEVREAIEGTLKAMIPGFLTTVGVMSPDASKNPMAQMMGQRSPPQEFSNAISVLEAEFDVQKIDLTEGKPIPRQISILLIIRPENFSDKAIWEIDQFLMRGGRLVVCADSFSFDLDRAMQLRSANQIKRVEWEPFRKFLRHLGADVGDSMIRDSNSEVVRMMRPTGRGEVEFLDVKLPYFVYVEGFDKKHDIVAQQRFLLLDWATPVRAAKAAPGGEGQEPSLGVPAGVEAREIAWTSETSSTSTDKDEAEAQRKLNYKPPPDAKREPVVLVLRGVFPSYFAGKPVPGEKAPESRPESGASRPEKDRTLRLDKSKETSVVVIGDSDFLSQIVAEAFGVDNKLRPNFTLLRNAIDFGGPEARLMAIRNRETVQRPLLGLRKFDEEERKAKTGFSRWMAFAVPCTALLLLGVGWAILRHNKKPLDLPARSAAS